MKLDSIRPKTSRRQQALPIAPRKTRRPRPTAAAALLLATLLSLPFAALSIVQFAF